MTIFWILAFFIALCTAVVVVLPLWRTVVSNEEDIVALNRRVFHERLTELEKDLVDERIDAQTLAELRTDLERNLLVLDAGVVVMPVQSPRRVTASLVLLLVPLLALGFYYATAAPQGLADWWQLQEEMGPTVERMLHGHAPTEAEISSHTLADFVRVLQAKLQKNPQMAEGWFMLGMSYVQMDMAQPAQQSFERAWRLDGKQARYALAYAQTRIFSNEGQLDALSHKLLLGVLQQEPNHDGALLLLGLGAYRSGDYVTAVARLEQLRNERLLRNAQGGSAAIQQLEETLLAAREQLRLASSGQSTLKASAEIRVKVTLDRKLAGKFKPDDVLYVFARALKGPPMPLAVVRRTAADLPLSISLDDSHSMMPSHLLSSEPEIVITARISRHDSPDLQPGDLEAVAVPLRQNGQAQSIELVIQNVHP